MNGPDGPEERYAEHEEQCAERDDWADDHEQEYFYQEEC